MSVHRDGRDERDERDEPGGEVLSAHLGASANCSSIGSYVDYLFLSAAASGAVLAAISVALARPREGEQTTDPTEPTTDESAAGERVGAERDRDDG